MRRRLLIVVLMVCAAAAATLAIGATLASSPLAGLDKTYRALAPSARCDAGATKATAARRLRAAALKGAAKAEPKVLRRKKATMRRAIRLLRAAGELCEAPPPGAAPVAGGPPAPPAPVPGPAPGPAPSPPPPGSQTLSFSGSNYAFSPSTPATVRAGALKLELTNTTSTSHRVGVRTNPGESLIGQSPSISGPGVTTSIDLTVAAGTYEIFCGVGDHAALGMVVPLAVTP